MRAFLGFKMKQSLCNKVRRLCKYTNVVYGP